MMQWISVSDSNPMLIKVVFLNYITENRLWNIWNDVTDMISISQSIKKRFSWIEFLDDVDDACVNSTFCNCLGTSLCSYFPQENLRKPQKCDGYQMISTSAEKVQFLNAMEAGLLAFFIFQLIWLRTSFPKKLPMKSNFEMLWQLPAWEKCATSKYECQFQATYNDIHRLISDFYK